VVLPLLLAMLLEPGGIRLRFRVLAGPGGAGLRGGLRGGGFVSSQSAVPSLRRRRALSVARTLRSASV